MKFDSKTLFRFAVLLLLSRSATAHAQTVTNAPATRLPEQVVVGDRDKEPSLTVPDVRTAREAVRSVPGGASLVPAEEFRNGRVSTMKDALEYVPGVFVQPRFGSDEARIAIRGSGLQRTFHGRGLKLLVDGVPLNLADGGFDMQAVEPLAVDYIEVLRGGNALRYGGTTLGGAINYVSPTGYTADPALLRFEAGSYGYYRGQISSGLVLGPVDYYVSVSHASLDGFRAHSKQYNERVFGNIGYKISDSLETRFYYTYVLTDSELPGSIFKSDLESNPQRANDYGPPLVVPPAVNNVTGNQKRDFELHRVANKTTWQQDHQRVEVTSFWSHKDLDHPISPVVDQNSNDFGVDVRYRNSADLFGRKNEAIAGFSPTWGWIESVNFANVNGRRGAKTAQSYQTAQNLDFYTENRHWLTDKFSFIIGAQASWANRDLDDRFGTFSFNEDYFALNPKLGFIHECTPEIQAYGNVSRSFEPPSFSEMGGVGGVYVVRDAQTAWTVELGTRGDHGRFGWDVTGYHAWVDNELLTQNLPGSALTSTINAGTTIHMGVEAGANVRLFEGILASESSGKEADAITARLAYQWNNFHFQDDPVFKDNRLAGVPEHLVRFEMMYQHPKGFYAGPNVEWSALKYPIDHANTFFADPYAVFGFKAGWRSKKGLSLFIEGRNLADKRYAATTGVVLNAAGADQRQFLPGDGRAFYGGVEWRF